MIALLVYVIVAASVALVTCYGVMIVCFPPAAPRSRPPAGPLPRVSILKPVKSLAEGIGTNLESFFTLDYPDYEIVFGVDCETDPCVPLLNEFQDRYPAVPARIVSTDTEKNQNPKVHTLVKAAAAASGTLFWVSDANTSVEKDTLKSLVAEHLSSGAAIVFSPIRGSGSASFGSVIENSYLNLFVSGNVIGSWKLFKKAIIVGKSMLIDRGTLEAMGGFERFRRYLAEDYLMGKIYAGDGRPLSTNFTWITNICSASTVGDFWNRAARWAKMRFRNEPFFYPLEIFANPIGLTALLALIVGHPAAGLLLPVVFSTMIIEYAVFLAAGGEDRKKRIVVLMLAPAVIVKAALLLGIYVVPFFSATVNWRGRRLRIGRDSVIIES